MIATGGLLRINARRQDSLKSKPHKAHSHKRKNKKKRRSEVVVVKGKLKLISVSGLVAAVGILVLMVGMVMAGLGYWPRDGLFFSIRPQEGAAMASVSSSTAAPAPADMQGGQSGDEFKGPEVDDSTGGEGDVGGGDGVGADEQKVPDDFNQTESINGSSLQLSRSFLEDFLDKYLYSDRLKVFGPLIMGIGIFLFICANAVLHENRDKKTKVINLRDIYSTVIDLHSLRKPNASSNTNPLNGLVNYVQSKSLETKPRAYPASLLSRRQGSGGGGGGGGDEAGGERVFSIYQEQPYAPPTPSSIPLSLSSLHLPTDRSSLQKEALSSFTLPLRRPRPPAPRRRHSARAGIDCSMGGEEEELRDEGVHGQAEVYACPSPLCSSTPPLRLSSCSSSTLHKEAPGGSQALLLLSSSSLSSLSHLLSSSSSTPPHPCRRRSLPTTGGGVTGYSKLTHAEEESFESAEILSSHRMTSHRKYSNQEKLRMISQVDSSRRQEEEEGQDDSLANQELT